MAGLTNWRWLRRFWHSDMGVAPATWQFAELLLVCEAAGVKADQAEPEFAASIGELTAIKKAAAPRPTSQARHRAEATRPRARAFLLQRAPTEESWATQTSKGSAARNTSREALDPSLVKVPNGWTYKHASTWLTCSSVIGLHIGAARRLRQLTGGAWSAPNSRLWQVPT